MTDAEQQKKSKKPFFNYYEIPWIFQCQDGRCHHRIKHYMVERHVEETGAKSGALSWVGKACPKCRDEGNYNPMLPLHEFVDGEPILNQAPLEVQPDDGVPF